MERVQTLLQAARSETGLDDFGPDTFREGLEVLVDALRREARLNALGEQVLCERILGHLKQRLQIEDWYRRHPEIDEQDISQPLIGLSLPRTGSTALSYLLAEDPNARYLRRWEAAQPCPPPASVTGPDPRSEAELAKQRAAQLKSHTPSGGKEAAECQDLMALDFKSHIFQAFAQVPSYSAWLLDADLTSTYLYERRALKLLQWGAPQKPWRLKCPTHLLFLDQLNEAFPDARFVMTHREPSDVMRSVIDVYVDIVGQFTDQLDVAYLAELNITHWSEGMRRALAFRDAGNDARFHDIDFRAMHADPIGEVRNLYRWLGEPVSEEFESGMARWWRENAENREPAKARAAVDDDIDRERVRSLFADYSARFVAAK